jgi:hypothetical protein
MSDSVAILVLDEFGLPKIDAAPSFVAYKSKAGAVLTPPAVSHVGGGVYGFVIPDADVAAGVAYLVSTGAEPAYFSGSSHLDSVPFDVILLFDSVGNLWVSDAPTVGLYSTFLGVPRAAPVIAALDGAHLYALIPSAEDVAAGVAYRVDAPPGAAVSFFASRFALVSSVAGDVLGEMIYAALIGDATLTSLIGTRAYPNKRPQTAAFPLLVYSVVSQVPENALAENAQTRLKRYRLQLDVYAKTYKQAHQVATAAENVVANLSSPDLAGWKDTERDIYDDESSLHRVSCDYIISSG